MNRMLSITVAALILAAANLGAQAGALGDLMSGTPQVSAPSVSGASAVSAPAAATAPAAAPREWLVMVFINGVNDLGLLGSADASVNEMETVGSSANTAVVVEYGVLGQDGSQERNLKFQRGAQTLFITRDADVNAVTSPAIYASNDSDMGSANHLLRFVKRAVRRYPAKKVMLVVWNHGNGRLGISYDDVSQNHMEVDALGRALSQVKDLLGRKLDVFATDACYMQMAAVAYELRNSAEVLVGSQIVVPSRSFPYAEILSRLPGLNAEQAGIMMVDAYGSTYGDNVTLSALRASALDGFVSVLNNWVGAVRSNPVSFEAAASEDTVQATYSPRGMRDSKDLEDYVDQVGAALPTDKAVQNAGTALKRYMDRNLILRATSKPSMTSSHGLSIYIPELRYGSANYEKLAFARDSYWDDYLRDMMKERIK